ncbi:helix-turn-helix domain-containing protein (plasmid) [Photobacterium sp. CCB-ST2H9]|uniref:helix-turn-helix domain-containing protein n=1 Tax=Photobacterium sp. CCB-ST2H9 TaxID=2912855 RepID=UPI002002B863|nr:helix-turn-helix transcriptional regulator [Photobacterium sp. CCB-ST2H9]UTM60461.1 helix-turn-helix domain-containing protein [Photobacterium sp. CCB-ST2H9]
MPKPNAAGKARANLLHGISHCGVYCWCILRGSFMPLIQTASFQGSSLECARGLAGLELSDLSELTGVNVHRLARIETGADYPTDTEVNILASSLNVLPHFFNKAWVKLPEHAINIKWNRT